MARSKILVVLYSHPELFPPTLNAVINLAERYGEVHLLYRPHKRDEWVWPSNVHLHPSGKEMTIRQFMSGSTGTRMATHARFVRDFLRLVRRLKPETLLLYDAYPALFYRAIRFFVPGKPFVWYHSHDVIEGKDLRTGDRTIGLLKSAEKFILGEAGLFTLPAVERKPYYDLSAFKGRYATIPNFPSRKVFHELGPRKISGPITLAFQGSICEGRGLEGVIASLPMQAAGHPVRFSITGFCNDPAYFQRLKTSIADIADPGAVTIREAVPYGRLQEAQKDAHVGWAYYGMDSDMDQSIGTASNKFFEACAMGLPVLYNGDNSFEAYRRFEWAFPVQPSRESLSRQMQFIAEHYECLSAKARDQFLQELNFEIAFEATMKLLPDA
ncbi:MAG TPA: hypothetical protein VHE54_02290 [Puia sp.]|nr:hypothetical protein [Puia sp.]